MGELLTFSQSHVLLSSPSRLHFPRLRLRNHTQPSQSLLVITSPMCLMPTRLGISGTKSNYQRHQPPNVKTNVVSDSSKPTTFTVDPPGEGIDVLPESGGSGGSSDRSGGGGGDGGGDSGGDVGGGNGGDGNESEAGKKKGMSMSQKITLGYAALVGIGGLMGFLKGGSRKSLIAGGGSAALLGLVYMLLPSRPVLASCLGLGLSASLLGVMGSRFKRSGKIFPAGAISLASLIMSVGYVHGILRSAH